MTSTREELEERLRVQDEWRKELEADRKEIGERLYWADRKIERLEEAVRFAHANSDVRLKDEWADHMKALEGKQDE